MRLKILAVPLIAALALLVPGGAHADPTVVGTDPAGDWSANDPDLDPLIAPLGGQLGQDLVSAAIERNGDNVNFIIGVSSLPPNGGVPEFTRYTWAMAVDGKRLELDGKFTNYSRGTCDPTAGSCPPPRDPGQGPFVVRGNCTSSGVITCDELGLVHATFDAGSGTITIPVPHALLGSGCVIEPAPTTFATGGESVQAAPSAYFTTNALPLDLMEVEVTVNIC